MLGAYSLTILSQEHAADGLHLLLLTLSEKPLYFCETDIVFIVDVETQ